MTLADYCARILCCPTKALRDQLNHPAKRTLILKELSGRRVRTTYLDRSGIHHTFTISDLTKHGADVTMAYGRLRRPFNICVAAHYYARHRFRLEFPYLPYAIHRFPASGEDRYYALELLEFVVGEDDENQNIPEAECHSIQSNASDANDSDEDDKKSETHQDLARAECSQHPGWSSFYAMRGW